VLKNTLKKTELELIFQIYYPDHETEETPLKTSPKKQRNKILNQINIEGWKLEKKITPKKNVKQKKIATKRIMTKFDIKIKWN
jgi:hypothetical protein